MTNILIYIISLLFLACCGIIELLARLFGWTYTETCVYINLYLQYGVLILSTLSVAYVAARKMMQGYSVRRLVGAHREHTLQYSVRGVRCVAI